MDELTAIKNLAGYYVSESGHVYSTKRAKEPYKLRGLKTNGYWTVLLPINFLVNKTFYIHRLVAETLIPNPDDLPQIDHINGIRSDNRTSNLRWVTCSQNVKYGYDKRKNK
jgi:hypothetical protein